MKRRGHVRVIALLFIPGLLAVALAWIAVGDPSFPALLAVNAAVTYPLFLALVVGYEWVVRRLGKTAVIWQHCTFVFLIVSLLQFFVNYFSFRTYGQYQWQETVIVSSGAVTPEGLRFLVSQAIVVGLKYGASIALFWLALRVARKGAADSEPS